MALQRPDAQVTVFDGGVLHVDLEADAAGLEDFQVVGFGYGFASAVTRAGSPRRKIPAFTRSWLRTRAVSPKSQKTGGA